MEESRGDTWLFDDTGAEALGQKGIWRDPWCLYLQLSRHRIRCRRSLLQDLSRDTREPGSGIFVGLTCPVSEEVESMMCPFCKQEVDEPCRNTVEMQRRASDHIERCDKALKNLKGLVFG